MTSNELKDWLAKNEVEQMMSQIFHRYELLDVLNRDAVDYHAMDAEHTEILGQFLDYTGMDVEQLKKCLAKGYLQMVQEAINKAIKEAIDT